jgi:hypothetical protein
VRASSGIRVTLALLLLAACEQAPTAVSLPDVLQERAAWRAHHLTRYAFVYEVTGFFINISGHPIRLVVRADTVRSATDMTTGDSVPGAAGFPTLDGLYDRAIAALSSRTLTAITYDATFSFPTRMDFAGPPDASGSILASGLELLP